MKIILKGTKEEIAEFGHSLYLMQKSQTKKALKNRVEITPQEIHMLNNGERISAIKSIRERLHNTLKEAVDIAAKYQVSSPSQ